MTRDEQILSLGELIEFILSSFLRQNLLFGLSIEDLRQEAWGVACEIVDNYDPSRNVLLKTYAEIRIRGRLIDSINRWSIGVTKKSPKHSFPIFIPIEELNGSHSYRPSYDYIATKTLLKAITRLSKKHQKTIHDWYCDDKGGKEISDKNGQSWQAPYQSHFKALKKLREIMGVNKISDTKP